MVDSMVVTSHNGNSFLCFHLLFFNLCLFPGELVSRVVDAESALIKVRGRVQVPLCGEGIQRQEAYTHIDFPSK